MSRSARLPLSRRQLMRGAAGAGGAALLPMLPTWPPRAFAQGTPTVHDLQFTQGVVYGEVDGTPLALNILQPPAPATARPAVIVIHGGGLVAGSRMDVLDPAAKLAQ